MSPTKLKSLLTRAFFAIIVIAVSSSVGASDLRPFKPYTPDSFGGGRRGTDGVYGSLSAIYWSVSTPEGGYIGATNAKGDDETRWVYDLGTGVQRQQTNSLKIDVLSPTTTLGTKLEVGNRRGQHGWLVGVYGLPKQGHSMSALNVSMAIRDEGSFDARAIGGPQDAGFLWGPNFGLIREMRYESVDVDGNLLVAGVNQTGWLPDFTTGEFIFYMGPDPSQTVVVDQTVITGGQSGQGLDGRTIFAYIPVGTPYYIPQVVEVPGPQVIAPIPVAFDGVSVNVNTRHRSAELMYTYRPHPFSFGSMELLGGARYWDFEDKFGFYGENVPLDTTVGGVTTSASPIRALDDMRIDASGQNCVVGPQFGLKLHRSNARWTFGAEGRFTAGINSQTVKTEGYMTPHRTYAPIGLALVQQNTTDPDSRFRSVYYGHKETKTYFSPILEGRLSADWQWTSAVSFFGAVNGMFADNIARGVRVTDYVVKSDGTIFGIRGNDRNTHVFVYGVEAGAKVNW